MFRITLLTLMLLSSNIYSLDDRSNAKGWFWGEEDLLIEVEDTKNDTKYNSNLVAPTNKEIVSEITSRVDELKAQAVLKPTVENVANYIVMQHKITNMANKFSDSWKKVMLKYPELDPANSMPTNNYAAKVIAEQKSENIKVATQSFSKDYGIVFFFKGNDTISTLQSEVIRDYGKSNNIDILPVSLNGISNKYFNELAADNGRSSKLGINVVPAMVAINVKTSETYPIGYGIKTFEQIDQSIFNFMRGAQ